MSVSISWFVIGIIYNLFHCFLFLKLSNSNEKLFSVKSIILSMLFSIINLYVISQGINVIRPVVIHVCYVLIIYFSYKTTLSKATIAVLISAVIFSIGELLVSFLSPVLFNINFVKVSNAIQIIVGNAIIFMFVALFFNNKKVYSFLTSLIKWCIENKLFKIICLSILVLLTLSVLLSQSILQWNSISSLLIIDTFIICILIFIVLNFKENSDRNKLAHQYDKLLGHVQAYEKLIIEKSKDQHEYKNQLILLRGLISKNNKKAIDYVNQLLDISNKDINYNWLTKLNNIPSGGLKGLIYYKVSQMQEQDIKVYIDISKELEQEKVWKTCDKYLRDVSRVIGVYIDNAIEASIHANKKYVIIEAELVNYDIVFSFSNTYAGSIDVNSIDSAGFSTKGKGKGYGLSLVRDIVDKNSQLEQKREINGIYFVQKLIIRKK